ncbi:CinA-like protein [Pichia kudriavzevii]|uniref:CinA-like protein n=2 Tax=Pichia kudriavzevii TaxID=4909 RepID=A0A1V2LUF5_PICKU|nr:CinA-like protein [Pichia kudriavzevii]
MNFPPEEVQELVREIADILVARNQTVSVSEGACGGLLSAYLIAIPGASRFFDGGRLIYSLKSRLKLSGWNEEQIKSYTGPSEQVALKMARNLRIEFGSTYVLSETGYAGPSTNVGLDNDSINDEDAKVGTVYIGIAGPKWNRSCEISTDSQDRSINMQLFAKYTLKFFLENLKNEQEGK